MKIKVDILVFFKPLDNFRCKSYLYTWWPAVYIRKCWSWKHARLFLCLFCSTLAVWKIYVICSNVDFKVTIPTLIGQIMMQYLGFISYFKALLSHYKISFRKTGSGFWCGLIPLHLWLLSLPCKRNKCSF